MAFAFQVLPRHREHEVLFFLKILLLFFLLMSVFGPKVALGAVPAASADDPDPRFKIGEEVREQRAARRAEREQEIKRAKARDQARQDWRINDQEVEVRKSPVPPPEY